MFMNELIVKCKIQVATCYYIYIYIYIYILGCLTKTDEKKLMQQRGIALMNLTNQVIINQLVEVVYVSMKLLIIFTFIVS